ncbi:uncharacterized protein LOC131893105 [Tigriopus californicus]|uniref:uncharacterized protein LOC131893105 n=1 Tax=Tigriopus californicus TaxID=6832 RepID=UPI0027D9EFD3|nr:uncharacterized protein LOC131893105 [Tigriopus californicus]
MPQSRSECLSPLTTQSQRDRLVRRPLLPHQTHSSPTNDDAAPHTLSYDESVFIEARRTASRGTGVSPDQARTSPRQFATSSPRDLEGLPDRMTNHTPDVSNISLKPVSGRRSKLTQKKVKDLSESQTSDEEDAQPPGLTHKSQRDTKGAQPSSKKPKAVHSPSLNQCRAVPILILIMGIMAAFIAKDHFAPINPSNPMQLLSQGLQALGREFPNEKELLRLFEASVTDTLRFEFQPATILVTSDAAHADSLDCFLRQLMTLAARVMESSPDVEGLRADSFENRAAMQEKLRRSLAENQAVYLKDIHKVSGQTALALHAICDNEHAPVKRAILILSATGPGLLDSEVDVDNLLKESWEPELGIDKYSPIFSRISGFIGYFRPNLTNSSQYCK